MPKVVRAAVVIGILLLSAALLGYGAWRLALERGARAAARGDSETAARSYAAAERPFTAVPVLARLFPDGYSRAVYPQVALLYARAKVDDAVGKLERAATVSPAMSEQSEFAFWNGNAMLKRALATSDPETVVKHLYAASAQYRKGLEAAPDDWDLKYNYELVQYILTQQERDRKKEEARIKSILERIRTTTEPGQKELPPEKRG